MDEYFYQELSFRVDHIPTELGVQGYAELVFLVNGKRIAHSAFAGDNPTRDEIEDKKFSMTRWLFYNPHFSSYQPAFHRFFYLRGIDTSKWSV